MAERAEEADVETEEELAQASPAAVAIALGRASRSRAGKPLDAKAEAFLEKQARLIDLQTEHLHEQRELQLAHLKVRRWKDRLSLALQALGVVGGAAIVVAVAAMAWNARQDHGLVIEAFSTPPDLAARGLTGQVAATQLLDRLAKLQARTLTARPASTYADDWGRDIKVEIPETGVSIGELNRYLRDWLGSETRISGEIVRMPAGLTVTARAGSNAGASFQGADADLDKLMGQAAEAVYAQTQPYRYAVYLATVGRREEAMRLYQHIAETGAREDRPWAYAGWAALLGARGDYVGQYARARQALAFGLSDETGAIGLMNEADTFLSHWEVGLADERLADRALRTGRRNALEPEGLTRVTTFYRLGDYRGIVDHPFTRNFAAEGRAEGVNAMMLNILSLARSHDVAGARRFAARLFGQRAANDRFDALMAQDTNGYVRFTYDDWPAAERGLRVASAGAGDFASRIAMAGLANAVSAQGRHAEAEALVARTPLDCDICVDARAAIAARRGDWAAAARWIELLEARSPSIPFAPTEHGKLLLDRGDVAGAIAEFAKAYRISPHFADPLELWGEALMARRDYAGAVARFAEADKSAPRWGRNHLMWGEALMLAGRYAEARRQYETANGLDLSRPDRAALDVLLARTARGRLHG